MNTDPSSNPFHIMIGITDEERNAFMTGMVSKQTADIKGEDDGEFFVEKVIKIHVNKQGKELFMRNGLVTG